MITNPRARRILKRLFGTVELVRDRDGGQSRMYVLPWEISRYCSFGSGWYATTYNSRGRHR